MTVEKTLKDIANVVESSPNTKAVFGNPITSGDTIIIPVAAHTKAGGSAIGQQNEEKENDNVGGIFTGYVSSRPVGYIQIVNDQASFIPIVDEEKLLLSGLAMLSAACVSIALIGGMFSLRHKSEQTILDKLLR